VFGGPNECYAIGASVNSVTHGGTASPTKANDAALRWLYKAIDLDPDFALAPRQGGAVPRIPKGQLAG
jgi:hypothetical protein